MLKRIAVTVTEIGVICVIALTGALFWASYYVDTDQFRQRFVQSVEQVLGQPAILQGELNIALYPTVSLEVLGLVVEGDSEFGEAPLVEFDSLKVSVRIIPLFSKKIEIRTIVVEGMKINVIRSDEGVFNWQSVIDRQHSLYSMNVTGGGGALDISLSGLEVVNATVAYQDVKDEDTVSLSGIDIRTGSIVRGRPVPFSANSRFTWRYGGIESQLILKGVLHADDSSENIRLEDATLYASVGGDFLPQGANPGELTASVVMDLDEKSVSLDKLRMQFLGVRAEGHLTSGDLSKELQAQGTLSVLPFIPATIVERYAPKAPVSSVDGLKQGAFKSNFQINEDGISITDMTCSLDDLMVRGKLIMQGYSHPVFSFDLKGGMVDLDRYLPVFEVDPTTPFVWADYPLKVFDAFRGGGHVHASGFKVLGQTFKDIKANAQADDVGIVLNATGAIDGKDTADLHGTMRIGRNENTGVPTLGMDVEFNSISTQSGFSFLNLFPLAISGEGQLKTRFQLSTMDCPDQGRSIDVLRHLSGEISLNHGAGKGKFEHEVKEYSFDFSGGQCLLKFSPMTNNKSEYVSFATDFSLQSTGDRQIKSFAVKGEGPLDLAVDKVHFLSSGMDTKVSVNGDIYNENSSSLILHSNITFDSIKHIARLRNVTLRTLKTTLKGEAQFSHLNSSFKGKGKLEVPGANARHIVYLLSRIALKTKDPEALKAVSVQSNFEVDKNGFRLSNLEGRLDGMSFNGHVVGTGFKNPKLAFSLAAGSLDLDRYLPPSARPTLEEQRAGKEHRSEPVDLPLTFFRMLRLNGKAWFEEFSLAKIRVHGLSGDIQAENGDIHVSNITGKVHDGELTADWAGRVGQKSLSTGLKLHVEDMQTGPLLKDMVEREYVRGETDVDFDLTSSGTTDNAIIENLNGKAWARIRNGSFKFTGYDSSTAPFNGRETSSSMGKTVKQKERRTVFQKAMGYFSVEKGIFTVDKYRIEAPPLLQSYGSGNFSLPANTVDLSIRNDFVAVPSVTINIVGKLSDPEVKVPKGKILDDTVRNILSLPEKSFNFLRDLFK